MMIVAVPVDDDGIRVDALARTDADLVLVTPAHQFPTGTVLSAERRAALVRWAMDGSRRIMEDDYDAEYRYDREPIGAIQGLAPEHVIYGGSASKTLAPGMRLGWLVAPADLVDDLASFKLSLDRGFAESRPAGLRRLPRARRVRPPSAADAADLPGPPRHAA